MVGVQYGYGLICYNTPRPNSASGLNELQRICMEPESAEKIVKIGLTSLTLPLSVSG